MPLPVIDQTDGEIAQEKLVSGPPDEYATSCLAGAPACMKTADPGTSSANPCKAICIVADPTLFVATTAATTGAAALPGATSAVPSLLFRGASPTTPKFGSGSGTAVSSANAARIAASGCCRLSS